MPNRGPDKNRLSPKTLVIIATVCVLAILALTACGGNATQVSAREAKKKAKAGLDAYQKGDFDKAVKTLETAVKDDPDNAAARKTLGQSYEALGKLDKAAKAYKTSLKEDPKQPQVLYNLAIIYKSQGETDKAIAELKKAVKANKQFAAARIILGDLYAQKGEKRDAKKQYQAVMNAAPFGIDLEQIKNKLANLDE